MPLNLVADFGGGGAYLVMGVLAALVQRNASGAGQVIDCAIVDGVASLTTLFHGLLAAGRWNDERESNLLDGGAPYYRTYATSDRRAVAVGAMEPRFYAHLLAGLGLAADDWPQHDRARWPRQIEAIAAVFAQHPRAHWAEVFAGVDACVTPVLSFSEATADHHLQARGTFVDWDGLVQPAPAPRLGGAAPAAATRPRAGRCSHTDEVLRDLGLSEQKIAGLRAHGAVA